MRTVSRILGIVLLVLLTGGCTPEPEYAPTPTKTPFPVGYQSGLASVTPTPLLLPTTTQQPTSSPTELPSSPSPIQTTTETGSESMPTLTLSAWPFPTPLSQPDTPPDHYVLDRPISQDFTSYLDRTYPYGGTAGGRLRPHTGVEFFNAEGTPVLAAANSIVEYAGTDEVLLFGPSQNFYGNLIILRVADATHNGQTIFLVYGHLSVIEVSQGDNVASGQQIGRVGGTGAANGGAHLHFEVRIGDYSNYYTSTRNPDLWIKPYSGYGTIAGRIVSESGRYLPGVSLTIRTEGWVRYSWTYAGAENIPDDNWGENFTYGDLPAGIYSITFSVEGKSYREQVEIIAGQTSWLQFVVTGA